MMKNINIIAVILLFIIVFTFSVIAEDDNKGLYVEGGVLMKNGEEFKGIGVNYFDAFYRTLKKEWDNSYQEGFKILSEYDIPFVRFMASGFWPSENKLYFEDKERYFELLDGVVKAAEEYDIGLIPSLFWCNSTVPDLMDEPRSAWGDLDSKTIEFMRKYTKEVVTRYQDSPAIWGWEFGNEYNLAADLPNAEQHRPPIWPDLGTRLSRSEKDDLTREMIRTAMLEFAKEVRKYDKHRIIITGNSEPRASAWHQMKKGTWEQDSLEQLTKIVKNDVPDPIDTISVHIYEDKQKRYSSTIETEEFLNDLMNISEEINKPLFVGEFGANEENGHQQGKEKFESILNAIEAAEVPLAAVWVYDFEGQKDVWNITKDNNREYQLQALQKINQKYIIK